MNPLLVAPHGAILGKEYAAYGTLVALVALIVLSEQLSRAQELGTLAALMLDLGMEEPDMLPQGLHRLEDG